MRKVDRSEILDLGAYEGIREQFRARIIRTKKNRRVALGEHMTLIFENRDTVLFQVQEMLRTERITKEAAIRHELDTYNDLVGDEGELSATLMIEYDDPAERARMLAALADLDGQIFVRAGEREVAGVFRPAPGEEPGRLPAVNYLRFPVGEGAAPLLRDTTQEVSVLSRHPAYRAIAVLPAPVREELATDLED